MIFHDNGGLIWIIYLPSSKNKESKKFLIKQVHKQKHNLLMIKIHVLSNIVNIPESSALLTGWYLSLWRVATKFLV